MRDRAVAVAVEPQLRSAAGRRLRAARLLDGSGGRGLEGRDLGVVAPAAGHRVLELAQPAAERPAEARQALGPEDEQGDDEPDDDLGGTDGGHGGCSLVVTGTRGTCREAVTTAPRSGRTGRAATTHWRLRPTG